MYARTPSHDVPHTLDKLPAEILLEIANYLLSRSDILQLCRVSSTVHGKVIPALYAHVELHGVEQCERTLGMLQRSPLVARHIRRLSVFPEDDMGIKPRDQIRAWDNAGVVSRCVMKTARHLDALSHFDWDGEDMLPDDRMWSELRARCPRLRHVGTTFGCFLPRPTSALFKFVDLAGFSLTLKDGFYTHSLHLPSRGGSDDPDKGHLVQIPADVGPESEPVFTRFWDMLTVRCPNLESLRIVGNPSESSEATWLYKAHWPKLRHLAVGALVWNTNAGQVHTTPDFIEFLERHPSIESLHLLTQPSTNQVDLSALSADALPNLKDFSGSFALLRVLVERTQPVNPAAGVIAPQPQVPNQNQPLSSITSLSKTLQRVSFPHAMHLRDLTPLAISRVLTGLHALTSIKVTFAIQGGYDSNGMFRTIVSSCPQLLELDVTCTNRASVFLDAFANSLRGLSRLQKLSLSLVRMPGEEPMHIGASRIALANPRLKSFSISFIPTHIGSDDPSLTPLERGVYELTCDAHGIPIFLHVTQRYTTPWHSLGLGLILGRVAMAEWVAAVANALGVEAPMVLLESSIGASALTRGGSASMRTSKATLRRWRYDLRPSGHPDVAQKGIGELLMERSPAGEEARLMMFCLSLIALTVWALVSKAQ